MKKNVVAHIESNGSGLFSIYVESGNMPFFFYGEGRTIDEAKKDFYGVYNEAREDYVSETGNDISAEFEFVYDMSAILQECKNYVSFAYLAKVTGINKWMLSQYACGIRKPKPAQRERIINGIHTIGNQCLAIK